MPTSARRGHSWPPSLLAPAPGSDSNLDPEVKNGIVSVVGELYYYVNGVKTYAGLFQIDGDCYYVNSYCKVITSQRC